MLEVSKFRLRSYIITLRFFRPSSNVTFICDNIHKYLESLKVYA